VLEQPARVFFALDDTMPRTLQFGHVFDGNEHAVEARLVARQHAAFHKHVKTPAAQHVIDRLADEMHVAVP
jgi:hypothetical protein